MAEKKPSRSELKRQAILVAAKQAFQENGVKGTSMDQLATRAQVSKRTVYNHFPSKEALVIHLVTDLWKQAAAGSNHQYRGDSALAPQLAALLQAELELICSSDYLELARVAFGHYFYHPEALKAELEKHDSDQTPLHQWLAAAQRDGRLQPVEIETAITRLHGMIKGECFWPQLFQLKPQPDASARAQLAAETAAIFLNYYEIRPEGQSA
ncbi:TetR/AcrR family transcriptional regulator [Neptuniibacter halophilus]|uniref:TetR/AcrR family transcriptional regulator n=1 Tax=Neptuniibacter halophilus TaxID=651666 RepID=UPI002574662F|nr:TetR/AcrR family transcriptional regulator [Neptuniibacter halophilus]